MKVLRTLLIGIALFGGITFSGEEGFTQEDRERLIRLEATLRTFMEQVDKRFKQVDKRTSELREDMNARFEQVDKRFEQVDKRFEQVDKRLEELRQDVNYSFLTEEACR